MTLMNSEGLQRTWVSAVDASVGLTIGSQGKPFAVGVAFMPDQANGIDPGLGNAESEDRICHASTAVKFAQFLDHRIIREVSPLLRWWPGSPGSHHH